MGEKNCAECGAQIVECGIGRPRRFCSDKCKMATHNRRTRRSRLPLGKLHDVTCTQCGTVFQAKHRSRQYCGQSCKTAAYMARADRLVVEHQVNCDGCGAEFTAVRPEARWCSKGCANRHWGNVRARQRGQLSEAQYTDLEIFERDGWRCHLCRKPVNREVPRLHPDGATIDHLIPTSLGGVDEPANVATAHWKCNRDKGARAMGEQLALI